ncbi:ATP-binding protein [soil metagenome]
MLDTIEKPTQIDAETIDVPDTANETAVGRIAAPNRFEATSSAFYFWIKRGKTLEENQIVFSESNINGEEITFYALIDEIKRTSRRADMTEEYDIGDGDVNYEPPFSNEGFSYAHAQVLRTVPEISTPPIERSIVNLGKEEEAKIAYGFDEISRPMAVGLLKNGAKNVAGNGLIDLDYLLGENGGHLNVNGMAGVGTKTTFLLTVIKSLQKQAEISENTNKPLFIVPIILNVKGEDLMWLDRKNSRLKTEYEKEWNKLEIAPEPFTDAEFYTAKGLEVSGCHSTEYSWSFHDVLKEDSLLYIFSEDDDLKVNMISLIRDLIDRWLDNQGNIKSDAPKTWRELLAWIGDDINRQGSFFGAGTWRAIYSRLWKVLDEGKSIFPKDAINGNPLKIARNTTSPPQVIDIAQLSYSLQRFVVGSILKQAVQTRKSSGAIPNLRYVIMLDELNRFAPRGAKDELTQLLEQVATEMRSQGVILLGAQQMASQVSTKVVEMASIRAMGRTGSAELTDKIWSVLEKTTKEKATKLTINEKLVWQPTFRQPMLVKMPMNPWADKRDNVLHDHNDEELKGGI